MGRRLEGEAAGFQLCALATGVCTDATRHGSLAIFLRGVDDGYDVTEEVSLGATQRHN